MQAIELDLADRRSAQAPRRSGRPTLFAAVHLYRHVALDGAVLLQPHPSWVPEAKSARRHRVPEVVAPSDGPHPHPRTKDGAACLFV